MMLEYQPTVADLAEPNARLFLRTSMFRKQRLIATACGPLGGIGVVYLFSLNDAAGIPWSYILVWAAIIAIIVFFAYEGIIRRKFLKYVEQEYGSMLPTSTLYVVDQDQLSCSSLGVTITFSLADLEVVSEDEEYIELSFGKRGLCVIPHRAFDLDSLKSDFLSHVERFR